MKTSFSFGKNWKNYARNIVNAGIIEDAKRSLISFIPEHEFKGKTFIDIGCGSGLYSLSALLLGCKKVISFDADNNSVVTANFIRDKYKNLIPGDSDWQIFHGSILDVSLIDKLSAQGDLVYSWGVLHHTGNMWKAIDNAMQIVKPDGYFIVSIYNRAPSSEFWRKAKQVYNSNSFLRPFFVLWYLIFIGLAFFIRTGRFALTNRRGMHLFYDAIDWLGGYPYEFASFKEINNFIEEKCFMLIQAPTIYRDYIDYSLFSLSRILPVNTGCNEFVFKKKHIEQSRGIFNG